MGCESVSDIISVGMDDVFAKEVSYNFAVGLKELSHFHVGIGAFQHLSEVRVHAQLCQVFLDDG